MRGYLKGAVQRQQALVLDGVQGVQVHVEQEEDEAVERRAQAVAQAPDARDHPLDHPWRTQHSLSSPERTTPPHDAPPPPHTHTPQNTSFTSTEKRFS